MSARLTIADLRKRMVGRTALLRLRNRIEQARGSQLESLVASLEQLANDDANPPDAAANVVNLREAAP